MNQGLFNDQEFCQQRCDEAPGQKYQAGFHDPPFQHVFSSRHFSMIERRSLTFASQLSPAMLSLIISRDFGTERAYSTLFMKSVVSDPTRQSSRIRTSGISVDT